jgi:DNA-binding CsgD family transcriptional regulator/PAS domain-containing protein
MLTVWLVAWLWAGTTTGGRGRDRAVAAGDTKATVDALLRYPTPLAILEMSKNNIVDTNAAFAGLLQLEVPQVLGLCFVSVVAAKDQAVVRSVLEGVASGAIQSCRNRAHICVPGGTLVDVIGWVRPLDPSNPGGRAVLGLVPTGGHRHGTHPLVTDVPLAMFCTLDHDGRFAEISRDAALLVGWDVRAYRGTLMQAAVHPDDTPLLLVAFRRGAAQRRRTAIDLRIRTQWGNWQHVRCDLSPICDHSLPRFAISIWCSGRDPEADLADERAARLEEHLWRIGAELEASGVLDVPVARELRWSDPLIRELSDRQVEVLHRLARGERVASIAESLYLSKSTVRNHLVAIYRKVGVHSQPELLARLRAEVSPH